MLLSLPTANRISSWIQHLPGIQKGTSPARALPRLVDVRNGAALTAPAGRLFTRNPALSSTFASGTQLRSQFQRLGNPGTGGTPVSRRIASLNARPHVVERHALCLPKGEPTRPPPRASELHPKALLQQLSLPPHRPLASAQVRAHVDTDALAALQPSAERASPLIETVNPSCYNPLFVRMDVREASAVEDDFGDAALLTDLEQLASECRFLREETEIRGVVPDLDAARLHDAILAGEPSVISRPAELLQHLLEWELKMYQAALDADETPHSPPLAATPKSEPTSRARAPSDQFNALLAEIRNFKRSAPAVEHPSSSVASPVSSPTARVFENALQTMLSVHGKINLSGASDGESDLDASACDAGGVTDSEWD